MNALRSALALTKHGALRLTPDMDCVMVDCEHSRTAKYSHQKASGQPSLDPTVIGVMPCARSAASSASSSGMVVGAVLIPACWNRSLRYQKPTTCRSYGTPYHFPFVCHAVAGVPSELIQEDTWLEMSASFPDWTWVACCPLPHCWKMSGGELPRSAGVILVLNNSFCIGTFWMVMFGCAASNDLMMVWNTPSRGCVLALFHHESVTLADELAELVPPVDVLELLLLELPLLHAAAAVAVATATAMAAIARLLRIGHLLKRLARGRRAASEALLPNGRFESFSNTFD